MPQMNIPEPNSRIVVAQDWSFRLDWGYPNWRLIDILTGSGHPPSYDITFPKGTVLKITSYRISSVSKSNGVVFRVIQAPDKRLVGRYFRASLSQAGTLVYDVWDAAMVQTAGDAADPASKGVIYDEEDDDA